MPRRKHFAVPESFSTFWCYSVRFCQVFNYNGEETSPRKHNTVTGQTIIIRKKKFKSIGFYSIIIYWIEIRDYQQIVFCARPREFKERSTLKCCKTLFVFFFGVGGRGESDKTLLWFSNRDLCSKFHKMSLAEIRGGKRFLAVVETKT